MGVVFVGFGSRFDSLHPHHHSPGYLSLSLLSVPVIMAVREFITKLSSKEWRNYLLR